MSVNLLDLAKGYLTNEIIDKASSFLGESKEGTQSGFDHILPTLMGSMLNKAKDKSGANDLFNMVTRPELGGGLLDNIGDLFGGSESSNDSMNLGGTLLRSLLGDRMGSVVDVISSVTGMKSGSSSNLMKLALPFLMSIFGKKIKSGGLGLDGFLSLLNGQKDFVEKAAPAGFLDKMLGAFGVSGLGAAASSAFASTKDAITDTGKDVKDSVKRATSTGNSGGGIGKFLPWIILLAVLGLAYYLWKGCDREKMMDDVSTTSEKVKQGVDNMVEGTKKMGSDIYDFIGGKRPSGTYDAETGRYVYDIGNEITINLPDGKSINVGKQSGENTLYSLITNDKFTVSDDKSSGWFTLDGVFFETGSANLDASSNARLENLAAILKAYPDVAIKFGGYTDNVGSQEVNQPLSQKRAEAAMRKVATLGVGSSRMTAEGYGEEHPICPANDTDACKAMNRRVDVRITQK